MILTAFQASFGLVAGRQCRRLRFSDHNLLESCSSTLRKQTAGHSGRLIRYRRRQILAAIFINTYKKARTIKGKKNDDIDMLIASLQKLLGMRIG